MKARSWLAVALGGAIAMTTLLSAAPAQEKKAAKAAPQSKTEQAMPGCGMHGMAAGAAEKAPAGKAGCAMMGGAAEKPGCAMGAGKGAGCGMGGGKACCCCMQGCCGMGKGGCGMKGGAMGKGGCGMMGSGPGMGGCGMKGGAMGKGGCGMMGAGPGMGRGPMGGPGMCGGPMAGMGPGPCGPDMGLGCGPQMMRELDLSADQQKKIADVCERYQRLMISSQAEIRVAELDLSKVIREDRPDRSKLGALIDTIARLRSNLAKARFGGQLDIRALLTPEQLEKWRGMPGGPMGMMEMDPGSEN